MDILAKKNIHWPPRGRRKNRREIPASFQRRSIAVKHTFGIVTSVSYHSNNPRRISHNAPTKQQMTGVCRKNSGCIKGDHFEKRLNGLISVCDPTTSDNSCIFSIQSSLSIFYIRKNTHILIQTPMHRKTASNIQKKKKLAVTWKCLT